MQRILHHQLRRQPDPLRQTHIGELGLLEDLDVDNILGADVLDVVARRDGDVGDVAGGEVHGHGGGGRNVGGHAGGAADEEVPFVGGGVPRKKEGEMEGEGGGVLTSGFRAWPRGECGRARR